VNDQTLRSKLIRLAHAKPELRPHLLPLLKQASHGALDYNKVPDPGGFWHQTIRSLVSSPIPSKGIGDLQIGIIIDVLNQAARAWKASVKGRDKQQGGSWLWQ